MAIFLLFKFYWKFTNVLQTLVKHHIHFTGHGSQAKCLGQSLAEPTPKACGNLLDKQFDIRQVTQTLACLMFSGPLKLCLCM
jgi:hypothetical protein